MARQAVTTRQMVATRLAALAMAVLLAGLAALTYAAYRGNLRSGNPVRVTVESDRAGLLLQPGALVKYHGVEVGRVVDVHQAADRAAIDVELAADTAADVPAGVGADVAATTVFGAKQVTLTDTGATGSEPIPDGAVIAANSVTVEANSIFDRVTTVLDAVHPPELQATLTALATAVRGKGADLGTALDDAEAVLADLDPHLDAVSRDIASGATTSEALADATPDLLATARSVTVTADTVARHRASLDTLLLEVTGLADLGRTILSDNTAALTDSLALSLPTSDLLAEYSPGLTCFIQGADVARVGAEKVSGGNGRSMLLSSTILFGVEPYRYPEDLPEVRATGGPRCGALPELTLADVPAPYVAADTGADVFGGAATSPTVDPNSLARVLFDGFARPGGPR